MNIPPVGDYIDIHTHDSAAVAGIHAIENIMAHEPRSPSDMPDRSCSFGIHPWHLGKESYTRLIGNVRNAADSSNLVAIGEAGFDRIRGADLEIQTIAFDEQVLISEKIRKPLFIHCVRAWDDLLHARKRLQPKMPWMIHGFRGKRELALQLVTKGMYLSFWFDFVLRSESSELIRSVPRERIFLETDGADVDIRNIYLKVSDDLGVNVEDLKAIIRSNFIAFIGL